MNRPTPKQQAPKLEIPLLSGGSWNLADAKPENFTLIVFYRGLHCPICKKYLEQLESLLPQFQEQGTEVIAISMDTEKRARLSRMKWDIPNLKLGYQLDEQTARDWGLYLSAGVKDGEPAVFSEPGLFLINSDHSVYYGAINSNPWGRPYLASFVKAVDYIISANYPARGELL